MLKHLRAANAGSAIRIGLVALAAMAVLILLAPTTAQANPPEGTSQGPEVCATCHADETKAWQSSTHSKGGVTCETCHGPFVAEHPQQKGLMKLDIESATCQSCHTVTYAQWKASPHGKYGVQCIGCHLVHSQQFRLTDVQLCGSCHKQVAEDQAHTAHRTAGISCVQCHVSSPDPNLTPSHTFTAVAENCVTCHGKTIHEINSQAKAAPLQQTAEQDLAAQLDVCQQTNKALLPMTAVNLGLGMGAGGLGGVILMLGLTYIRDSGEKR
jgi:hypothetical protein